MRVGQLCFLTKLLSMKLDIAPESIMAYDVIAITKCSLIDKYRESDDDMVLLMILLSLRTIGMLGGRMEILFELRDFELIGKDGLLTKLEEPKVYSLRSPGYWLFPFS